MKEAWALMPRSVAALPGTLLDKALEQPTRYRRREPTDATHSCAVHESQTSSGACAHLFFPSFFLLELTSKQSRCILPAVAVFDTQVGPAELLATL